MRPAQMFDRRLNPIKGWPSPYALDKAGKVSDAAADQGIVAGMVMHIDPTTGLFKRGLPGKQVPVFAWNGFANFDTMGADEGNISLYGNMKGVSGLVGLGSYELQTTEFLTDTYAPNTPLTVENGATVDQGKVKPGAFYTNTIVGVVSDGLSKNAHGRDIVTFWSYFLPASA
jgi:hypothetical protein